MGCSASKNAVAAFERETPAPISPTASKISNKTTLDSLSNKSSSKTYPPGEAFLVSLELPGVQTQGSSNSISLDIHQTSTNRKPPPKRLQKLLEQASALDTPKKIEDLQEKLDKADARRQNYLKQKLDTIQKTSQMFGKNNVLNNEYCRDAMQKQENESFSKTKTTNTIETTSLDDDSKHALLNASLLNKDE